jgi:superkiller protein 8
LDFVKAEPKTTRPNHNVIVASQLQIFRADLTTNTLSHLRHHGKSIDEAYCTLITNTRIQSKQYLQTHSIPDASPADIYSVAATSTHLITASGSSSLHVYSTAPTNDENNPYPLVQTLQDAHKLGAHHIAVSANGKTAASAGFGGEVKVWSIDEESSQWALKGSIVDDSKTAQAKTAGEIWAIALSENGQFLAATTFDGRINVWDLTSLSPSAEATKLREYETKGSFGMSVALSSDGEFTASGHANGAVYLFNNTTGRLAHSLQGLVKPVRTVAFSPASRFLAAGGDAKIVALYDVKNGEQVANLTGSQSWVMSLDWSTSGENLLSGYVSCFPYFGGLDLGNLMLTFSAVLMMARQRSGVLSVVSASLLRLSLTRLSGL